MLLNDIAQTSQRVTETPGRLDKVAALSACLRRLPDEEVEIGVSYLTGRLRQGNIGLGPAVLQAAHPERAAEQPTLTLLELDQTFDRLRSIAGAGSSVERRRSLHALLLRATREEQAFLLRLMLGELRQGALEGVMVDAVAAASGLPPSEIRRASMLAGDIPTVARAALRDGLAGVRRFSLQLLHPIHPMLAQPADDVAEAFQQWRQAAFEYKMDGARIQVHKLGDDIRVFSRTLNDVTGSVPDIVHMVRALPTRAVVLDGEVLALRADGLPHPFQITMRRFGRKLDVEPLRQTLPLTPFFFDCLHVDGDDLIDQSGAARHALLSRLLPGAMITPRLVTDEPRQAEAFLHEALVRGHEGVMAKSVDALYEAGRRGSSWLKIKRAHTLDLVVLAAEWGHGRRQGWLSNLHLGARNPEDGGFVMLGKTFKGLTDELLRWQTERLQALAIGQDGGTVYVRPELVIEIAFNDLQASTQYPGGLALRFARVKRYRPDKTAAQADTIDTVRALYLRQADSATPPTPTV